MKIKIGDAVQICWCDCSSREGGSDAAGGRGEDTQGRTWRGWSLVGLGAFPPFISKLGELHFNNTIFFLGRPKLEFRVHQGRGFLGNNSKSVCYPWKVKPRSRPGLVLQRKNQPGVSSGGAECLPFCSPPEVGREGGGCLWQRAP